MPLAINFQIDPAILLRENPDFLNFNICVDAKLIYHLYICWTQRSKNST